MSKRDKFMVRCWRIAFQVMVVGVVLAITHTLIFYSTDSPATIVKTPTSGNLSLATNNPPRLEGAGASIGEGRVPSLPAVPLDYIPGSTHVRNSSRTAALRDTLRCFGEKGRWEFDPNPRPLPWPDRNSYYARCDKFFERSKRGNVRGGAADKIREAGRWNVRRELKYQWKVPEKCGWTFGEMPWQEHFDVDLLCKKLDGRSIVFLGDSLTAQMETSFFSAAHMETSMEEQPQDASSPRKTNQNRAQRLEVEECTRLFAGRPVLKQMDACKGAVLCNETGNGSTPKVSFLSFLRNDYLAADDKLRMSKWSYELPIFDFLSKQLPGSIIVANRGAHYVQDAQLERELHEFLGQLRQKHPDSLLLYRSTPPGHADCMAHPDPIHKPQDLSTLPFNWSNFPRQNELSRRIVEAYGSIFLDVDPMTRLRPDGHMGWKERGKMDCLHYCLPGPLDIWSLLLYNALLMVL